jgi:hypothetical protein
VGTALVAIVPDEEHDGLTKSEYGQPCEQSAIKINQPVVDEIHFNQPTFNQPKKNDRPTVWLVVYRVELLLLLYGIVSIRLS